MSVSCIRRPLILFVVVASGCTSAFNNGSLTSLRGRDATTPRKSSAATDNDRTNPSAAKERGKTAATDKMHATNAHEAEIHELIETELADAPAAEREELFQDLKTLDLSLVKHILRIRQSVANIGQDELLAKQNAGTATSNSANKGQTNSSRQQPSTGFGHFGLDSHDRLASNAAADLGQANPWLDGRSAMSLSPGSRQSNAVGTGSTAVQVAARSSAFAVQRDRGVQTASANMVTSSGTQPPAIQPRPLERPISLKGRIDAVPSEQLANASGGRAGTSNFNMPSVPESQASAQPERTMNPELASPASASVFPLANQVTEKVRSVLPWQNAAATASPSTATTESPMGGVSGSSWKDDLNELISLAEVEATHLTPGSIEAERFNYIQKHVYLRLLYLMNGSAEKAMEPIPGLEPADQEFWQQTFFALWSYFDTEGMPERTDRATQTIAQLRLAIQRLQPDARLELRNVTFCRKISSFGDYERFDRDTFSPGQAVLVYAEVGNFKSEPAANGEFRTILKSTIEIYKAGPNGDLLERIPFPATEDTCRNHRRDYFHSYEFRIPQTASLGPHVLKLTVEDQLSNKIATYSVNFTVD